MCNLQAVTETLLYTVRVALTSPARLGSDLHHEGELHLVCREKLLQLSLCLVYRGWGAQLMVISLWGMEILQVLLLDSLANTSLAAMSSS